MYNMTVIFYIINIVAMLKLWNQKMYVERGHDIVDVTSESFVVNEARQELNELANSIVEVNLKRKSWYRVENVTSDRLTKNAWVFNWPSGRETYYNLDMSGVVKTMRKKGYSEKEYPYYVRKDWVKMLGDYVMVAANLKTRPRGTKLPTSLGEWIVCDTWGFVKKHPNWLDIATNW